MASGKLVVSRTGAGGCPSAWGAVQACTRSVGLGVHETRIRTEEDRYILRLIPI